MPQTPQEKAVAIKLKKQIMKRSNSKRDEKTMQILQEIIMQNDIAKNERRRKMRNQWQRSNQYNTGISFVGKHDDGRGHYLNKDGNIIGSTNPVFGDGYLEPIQSRKGTQWHFKQLGKID